MPPKNFSRKSKPSFGEASIGMAGPTTTLKGPALDWFVNQAARTGYGSPNLFNSTTYELVRFSYDYWQLITLYRNHWISRRIIDVPAQDMVRAWPTLTSDIDPKSISKLDRVLRRTGTKLNMLKAMQWGRLFGGAACLIVIEGHEHDLDQPLDLDDVPLGGYKGLIPFDRWSGIHPSTDICNDITRPLDFGYPEAYDVRIQGGESFKVHSSRILRFNGPEVPTPEKEAQGWWGISVLEPVYEEIKKRDNMSFNILALTYRANLLGLKFKDLASLLSGLGTSQKASQQFYQRMEAINQLMSNQSLIPVPEDGGLESTQYTFAGLSEVYQQFQLDISGAAEIPVSRLWGRTISGLGQSNDADERIYEEKIAKDQEQSERPQLEKLYPVLCMSELGDVPEDLDLNFPSVRVLDEKEKSELAKTVTDTVTVCINTGLMSQRTGAKEVKQSSAITGFGTNLTDEAIAKLPDEVSIGGETGGDPFGMGEEETPNLDPSSSPQKVLKEIAKEKPEDEFAKAADSAGFIEPIALDAGFEEGKHPRGQPNNPGQFASKPGGSSAPKMPKGMEHVTKGSHKTVASFANALISENKYSNEQIAGAAQTLFGGKTSSASIAWYKSQAKKKTPAGQQAEAKKQEGIAKNNAAIKAAAGQPMPKTSITTPATAFVNTGAGNNKFIITGLDKDMLSSSELIKAVLKVKGFQVSSVTTSEYNADMPAPVSSVVKLDVTASDIDSAGLLMDNQQQALAKAQLETQKKATEKSGYAKLSKTVAFHTTQAYINARMKTSEKLTKDQKMAVKAYTNGAYGSLNKALRAGQPMSKPQATICAHLDTAFKSAAVPFEADTAIYRKMSNPTAWLGPNPTVGTVLIDNGFISTSASDSAWSGNVRAAILMKKGQKALFVQNVSAHPGEKEIILPRGSHFKLTDVHATKEDGVTMHEVVLEYDES